MHGTTVDFSQLDNVQPGSLLRNVTSNRGSPNRLFAEAGTRFTFIIVSVNVDKENLREQLRQKRLAMPTSQVAAKSEVIIQKLIDQVDWPNIRSLHTYAPIQKLNEVDTRLLVDYLESNWPQIKVTTQGQSAKLPEEKPRNYDLIIVPTLAFDPRNFRLGWGGGFYDRFLASQPSAQKIGLCFSDFEIKKIPDEPHDIRLDLAITESVSVK